MRNRWHVPIELGEGAEVHVVTARPVMQRLIRRQFGELNLPPTEDEIRDAILLLAEPYQDAVGDESFRILDEYGR